MHARVTTLQLQPGKTQEALGIARNSVLPAARGQRGYRGMLALMDRDADKVVSITLWESQEDLQAGEESGYYREQLGKAAVLFAGEPATEVYEVGIQEE